MNYRKTMIAGATAAVIVGAGGTALAVTGDSTTSGTAASTPTSTHQKADKSARKDRAGKLLRRLEHGQFTVKGKDGKPVTHDLILGTVTAVSSSSITVKAEDSTSETFGIDSATKVWVKTKGAKPTATTITKIAKGAHVYVGGTGTSTLTAVRVVQVPTK